ncbi:hypothetical protein D3C85_1447320 [compost metagenome]
MTVDFGRCLPQRRIERLIQFGVLLARHRHAHHALQQPGILRQLGIVDLGDFVVAVMQVEYGDDQQAKKQQAEDQRERTPPDRTHRRSSTR